MISTNRNFITRKKFNQKYFYHLLKIVQIVTMHEIYHYVFA